MIYIRDVFLYAFVDLDTNTEPKQKGVHVLVL